MNWKQQIQRRKKKVALAKEEKWNKWTSLFFPYSYSLPRGLFFIYFWFFQREFIEKIKQKKTTG